MTRYAPFLQAYGKPSRATGAFDATAGEAPLRELQTFEEEVGCGVFAHGFLSVLSARERACGPNPWLKHLPESALHIATSAFGCLVAADRERAFVIDILLGNIMRTDLSVGEALLRLAEPESREGMLNFPLFERWREVSGSSLAPDEILVPAPLPVLGGQLAIDTIGPADASVAMSLTCQSYDGRYGETVRNF
jgi:hypothetical protein